MKFYVVCLSHITYSFRAVIGNLFIRKLIKPFTAIELMFDLPVSFGKQRKTKTD